MDYRPNINCETTKSLGKNLFDLGLGKCFLAMTAKEQPIKEQIDKLDYINIRELMLFERDC